VKIAPLIVVKDSKTISQKYTCIDILAFVKGTNRMASMLKINAVAWSLHSY